MDRNLYILSGDSYLQRKSVNQIKDSLLIQNKDLNITEFKSMPKSDELKNACFSVPFMDEKRMVIVSDCTVLGKGSAEESKKIAGFLEKIPDSTVLVLCTQGTVDKRRTLYKEIKKKGIVKEYTAPGRIDCINFVLQVAKELGVSISRKSAELAVDFAGCDYYTLENEINKLAVYCGFKEILPVHIEECISRTLEYNVFELHGMLINGKTTQAMKLLDDIMRSERPEGLIGLIARKIRDMYKVKALLDSGYAYRRIAPILGIKSFVADIIARESKKFTQEELRCGLKLLADMDYSIKSGESDAYLALPGTLIRIYKL